MTHAEKRMLIETNALAKALAVRVEMMDARLTELEARRPQLSLKKPEQRHGATQTA